MLIWMHSKVWVHEINQVSLIQFDVSNQFISYDIHRCTWSSYHGYETVRCQWYVGLVLHIVKLQFTQSWADLCINPFHFQNLSILRTVNWGDRLRYEYQVKNMLSQCLYIMRTFNWKYDSIFKWVYVFTFSTILGLFLWKIGMSIPDAHPTELKFKELSVFTPELGIKTKQKYWLNLKWSTFATYSGKIYKINLAMLYIKDHFFVVILK